MVASYGPSPHYRIFLGEGPQLLGGADAHSGQVLPIVGKIAEPRLEPVEAYSGSASARLSPGWLASA